MNQETMNYPYADNYIKLVAKVDNFVSKVQSHKMWHVPLEQWIEMLEQLEKCKSDIANYAKEAMNEPE